MTNSSYPKTSHLPLSESRVARFVTEARDTFIRSSLARLMLTQAPQRSDNDFSKIGFNNIVDRIWFVDGSFAGTSYGTPSGAPYGSTVAESETKLALKGLIEFDSHNETNRIIETPSDPSEDEVDGLLRNIRENGFVPRVIIASIKQGLRFWDFRTFNPSQETRRGLTSPEGYFQGVPVHHCRLLQDGVILATDKSALGFLEVKRDFNVSVSDIPDTIEQQRIRREVTSLSNADFNEKVRVLGVEVVKATIQHNAYALIKTSGVRLELNEYA